MISVEWLSSTSDDAASDSLHVRVLSDALPFPLVLRMAHRATADELEQLVFCRADQPGEAFEELPGGVFSSAGYAEIEVSGFSLYGIFKRKLTDSASGIREGIQRIYVDEPVTVFLFARTAAGNTMPALKVRLQPGDHRNWDDADWDRQDSITIRVLRGSRVLVELEGTQCSKKLREWRNQPIVEELNTSQLPQLTGLPRVLVKAPGPGVEADEDPPFLTLKSWTPSSQADRAPHEPRQQDSAATAAAAAAAAAAIATAATTQQQQQLQQQQQRIETLVGEIGSARADAASAATAAQHAAGVAAGVEARVGLRRDLAPLVKRATVRVGLLRRDTNRLMQVGSGTIIDAGDGTPEGQILTCAHIFVEPNPTHPRFRQPYWTEAAPGPAAPENIDWVDEMAPIVIMIGMFQDDNQPSRWLYWAELVSPLHIIQEIVGNPHAPHTVNQLLDLAVVRIRGSLEVSPPTFGRIKPAGLADVYTLHKKHPSILPMFQFPRGIRIGEPGRLQSGADKISVCGWGSPHGETILCMPDPHTIWGPSKDLLLSRVLLHDGMSGGSAVDHEGNLVAVNSMSAMPSLPVEHNYKAYFRMVSQLAPEHGLQYH